MNDPLDTIWDRYMEDSGGDLAYAFRLLSADYLYACRNISSGLVGAPPVAHAGFAPKPKVEAIDIPSGPEASNPS